MQCELCHERQATIALTTVAGDHKQILHLCPLCSQRESHRQEAPKGSPPPATPVHVTQVKKVSVVVGHLAGAEAKTSACPECGMTYEQFRKVGRLGCPRCYEAFGVPLRRLLKRIHGADRHLGRGPRPRAAPDDASLTRLREELDRAVQQEAYERAADLRDRIARLEDGRG